MDVAFAAAVQEVRDAALAAQLVNRSSLAALVFLLYDGLLTFADEVEYIWSKPHASLLKWLFLFLRWYTLVVLTLFLFCGTEVGIRLGVSREPYCRAWYTFQNVSLQIILALLELILAQRVYALYNRSRVIGSILLGGFITQEMSMLGILVVAVPRATFNHVCISNTVSPAVAIFGVMPFLFESLLLVLTLVKLVKTVRALGWGRAPLLSLIARDGLWAYLAVMGTFLLNGALYVVIRGPGRTTGWAWQYAIPAFAGTRLVLHMHTSPLSPGASHASTPGQVHAIESSGENAFALTTMVRELNVLEEGLGSPEGTDVDESELERASRSRSSYGYSERRRPMHDDG